MYAVTALDRNALTNNLSLALYLAAATLNPCAGSLNIWLLVRMRGCGDAVRRGSLQVPRSPCTIRDVRVDQLARRGWRVPHDSAEA
jgi:hypothetical protein